MPFALIPDGFSLEKVTKAQEQAVKDKRRHDDVLAILNNDSTPLLIAGVITALLIPNVAEQIAEDTGTAVDVVKESLQTAFYEGTLLGKTVGFAKDLDLSKLKVFGPTGAFEFGKGLVDQQ
tara:strand:+ start:1189 stop:1551 length:363 start_codon:yes stop_codon:yes gene_type:complete